MSVKTMAFVWDIACPETYNDCEFKPNHKYVLLAYADHADHNGKSIYPAIETIANKTGYDERTVQRITRELEEIGLLVGEGHGPRGTNRWHIPMEKGWQNVTPTKRQGDKTDKSLGDISSGDISSGDKLSPEFKELNQSEIDIFYKEFDSVWEKFKNAFKDKLKRAEYQTWIEPTQAIGFDDRTLTVEAKNAYARDWLEKHLKELAQHDLGIYIKFVIPEAV